MTTHENRQDRKERNRRLLLGLGVIIILFSLPTIVLQERQNYISQTNHHAATLKQQATIIGLEKEIIKAQSDHAMTLNEVSKLETEVASVIEALPTADTYILSVVKALVQDIEGLCEATHASCTATIPPL